MGVDDQLARRIAVVKGAVLGPTGRAHVRQRPDPAAEYLGFAVLVDHERQQAVDIVTGQLRHQFGNDPRLRLYAGQFGLDLVTDICCLGGQHVFIVGGEPGGDELTDSINRQNDDQGHEPHEGCGVASLHCLERGHFFVIPEPWERDYLTEVSADADVS